MTKKRQIPYETFEVIGGRVPSMPVEFYNRLESLLSSSQICSTPNLSALKELLEQKVVASIQIVSPSMSSMIASIERRPNPKLVMSLFRYLTRMSTRPTPFGTFASVGVLNWADHTDVKLSDTNPESFDFRINMEWLLKLVYSMELNQTYLKKLKLYANGAIIRKGGRAILQDGNFLDEEYSGRKVSVKLSRILSTVLEITGNGSSFQELERNLIDTTGSTSEKVTAYLINLIKIGLLHTDLRPPLTSGDPLLYVAGRLSESFPGDNTVSVITEMKTLLHLMSDSGFPSCMSLYEKVEKCAARISNTEGLNPIVSVNSYAGFRGNTVSKNVGDAVAKAADLLVRLSRHRYSQTRLPEFRDEFIARYEYRKIPLLEAIDADLGIGFFQDMNDGTHSHPPGNRMDLLSKIAGKSLSAKQINAKLTDDDIEYMTASLPEFNYPPSMDVFVSVLADSQDAIDKGNFKIAVNAVAGVNHGGRSLGRFSNFIKEPFDKILKKAAELESKVYPGFTLADMVFYPKTVRASGIMDHPRTLSSEIVLNVPPSDNDTSVIMISDLQLGIDAGRITVYSGDGRTRIRGWWSSMLSPYLAPAPMAFLASVSDQDVIQASSFDWGDLSRLPFLPRLEYQNIILSPAKWTISESMTGLTRAAANSLEEFKDNVAIWRKEYSVPKYIYIVQADNKLLINLENDFQLQEFKNELRKIRKENPLALEEALQFQGGSWVSGPGGHYTLELAVPLQLKNARPILEPVDEERINDRKNDTMLNRYIVPFSGCIYMKLYCVPDAENEIISSIMEYLLENQQPVKKWFYIRYIDTVHHVRLRLFSSKDRIMNELLPSLLKFGSKLVSSGTVLRFAFDSYEREIDRYGGNEGMLVSEDIFHLDSELDATVLNLSIQRKLPYNLLSVAVATIDILLESLGITSSERVYIYRAYKGNFDGMQYKGTSMKELIREVGEIVGNLGARTNSPSSDLNISVRKFLKSVGELSDRFRSAFPGTSNTRTKVLTSYIHMHCNRIFGVGKEEEKNLAIALFRYSLSIAGKEAVSNEA